ncbi:MAG: hypothetical protein HXY34_00210 [Candidatus Thorarchaeota archaeon]|nr:hypothetical protein [Candidatus Thorarchaeota archaeon]
MSLGGDSSEIQRDYKVVQKLVALRPVFEVYDESTGQMVAVARQTWTSIFRSTVNFEDAGGNRILTAKGGFLSKTFWLLDASGQKVAKITRPWIALRKSFKIIYRDEEIKAQGGYLAIGFEARSAGGSFAFKLNKKILAVRDQFRVSVGSYVDWLHAIAMAIIVDRVFFRGSGCGLRCICCLGLLAVLFIATLSLMLMP